VLPHHSLIVPSTESRLVVLSKLLATKSKTQETTSVGENANWYSHCGEWRFLKKLKKKKELPHNLVIPPLGICPKKMKTIIQKVTCTPMFIAALSTIAKIWKQP